MYGICGVIGIESKEAGEAVDGSQWKELFHDAILTE